MHCKQNFYILSSTFFANYFKDALRGNMQDALADDDEGTNSNPNSSHMMMSSNTISDTILATGVFNSAELYRLARASITDPTPGILTTLALPVNSLVVQRQQQMHHHHHLSSQQHLQHLHVKNEHDLSPSYLNCNDNGDGNDQVRHVNCQTSGSNGNSNNFSPGQHARQQHLNSNNLTSLTHPPDSSPSYVIDMTSNQSNSQMTGHHSHIPVNHTPSSNNNNPHKRIRRMLHSSNMAQSVVEVTPAIVSVSGHETEVSSRQQMNHYQQHHHQPSSWNESDESLIKTETLSPSPYTHIHVSDASSPAMSPHQSQHHQLLYHHPGQMQSHSPSHTQVAHHYHQHLNQVSKTGLNQHHQTGLSSSPSSVLKYQENGDTLSDFVNLVSAMSSDGHLVAWPDQSTHGSHPGSDPEEVDEHSKSIRDGGEEDIRLERDPGIMYGSIPSLPPPPPPPTARPVITSHVSGHDGRWINASSPSGTTSPAAYLLQEKDNVGVGYFRPAFFVTSTDPSQHLMLMQHPLSAQDPESPPSTSHHLLKESSPPKTCS